ncbi:ABC transporter ATP-binding protein [Jiella sp. M17.18]|uniref:ABC transporter ATP-binding protein n=1 Tax=Jiella sp. M17.18 TaxID=3234247 RepID=UPI0034E02736
MTDDTSDVRFASASKRFGRTMAVRDLSLAIPRGAFFALLGPSGCGKTTTLRMIAGFETPTSGNIFIRGENVTRVAPYRRSFGMVFQNYALFPHMSVAENVAFGLKMRHISRSEREERVREALAIVQLNQMADRYPKQLSGGQQQRVALARAIVIKPAVLLLDEPLGALDKLLREEMQVELRSLQKSLGITTVFVTHDQEEALAMADQVAVMRAGEIEQIDAPGAIYERPATEFVASFLGASNFFDGEIQSVSGDRVRIDIGGSVIELPAVGVPRSGRVKLAIRPEKIKLAPAGQGRPGQTIAAVIREVVYKGPTTHVIMDRSGTAFSGLLQNDATRDWSPAPGMVVDCAWAESSLVPMKSA